MPGRNNHEAADGLQQRTDPIRAKQLQHTRSAAWTYLLDAHPGHCIPQAEIQAPDPSNWVADLYTSASHSKLAPLLYVGGAIVRTVIRSCSLPISHLGSASRPNNTLLSYKHHASTPEFAIYFPVQTTTAGTAIASFQLHGPCIGQSRRSYPRCGSC